MTSSSDLPDLRLAALSCSVRLDIKTKTKIPSHPLGLYFVTDLRGGGFQWRVKPYLIYPECILLVMSLFLPFNINV